MADTGVLTTAKSRIFVSATPYNAALDNQSDAAVLAAFEALADWKEINEITQVGEIGGSAEVITHMPINTGVVKKFKGIRNRGQAQLVMARRPADLGQAVLIQANNSKQSYVFKVVAPDGEIAGIQTPSTIYFNGKVMSYTANFGQVNNIIQASATIEIDDKFFELAAEAAS